MIPNIFDVADGELKISVEALTVPELKAIVDYYKDPIPAMLFLYHRFNIGGAYTNITEDEKEDRLLEEYPGEYTVEDDVMIDAIRKIEELYMTPVLRYYLDCKILMERIGEFARDATIEAGKDGNFNQLSAQLRSVGKTINEFKILEKTVREELKERKRVGATIGNKKLGYDQQRMISKRRK